MNGDMPNWNDFLKNVLGDKYILPSYGSKPPQQTKETEGQEKDGKSKERTS